MTRLTARKINVFALPNLTKRSLKEKETSIDPFAVLELKGKLLKNLNFAYRLHSYVDYIRL